MDMESPVTSFKTRIHGELYVPLLLGAEQAGEHFSRFVGGLIAEQVQVYAAAGTFSFNDLTDVYMLKTAVPVSSVARAKDIRITMTQKANDQLLILISKEMERQGRKKPSEYEVLETMPSEERKLHPRFPAFRNYSKAYNKCFKRAIVSMLLTHCQENNLLS